VQRGRWWEIWAKANRLLQRFLSEMIASEIVFGVAWGKMAA
jgi:hypothetical protein